MASIVIVQLRALLLLLAVILPASTKLEYTDTRPASKAAFSSDDDMQNDDLISPLNADCSDGDDVKCIEVQSRGSDALIYPISVQSTAKPSLSTRRHAEPPLNTQTAPTSFLPRRESPCTDDEDCSDTSGDISASVSAGLSSPDDVYSNRRSTEVRSNARPDDVIKGSGTATGGGGVDMAAVAESKDQDSNQTQQLTYGDGGGGEGEGGGGGGERGLQPLPNERETTGEVEEGDDVGYGMSTTLSSVPGSGSSAGHGGHNSHLQFAINMNIILMVGIAVGLVMLLLILIVAACKYKGQGSKSPPMGKTDRAKSYTYEACNTGPPPPPLASTPGGGGGDPDAATKSRSSASIAVGLPTYPTSVTTTIATPATAAPTSQTKPARKGVKEWYV